MRLFVIKLRGGFADAPTALSLAVRMVEQRKLSTTPDVPPAPCLHKIAQSNVTVKL